MRIPRKRMMRLRVSKSACSQASSMPVPAKSASSGLGWAAASRAPLLGELRLEACGHPAELIAGDGVVGELVGCEGELGLNALDPVPGVAGGAGVAGPRP